jgi:hypothetical protein
MTIKDNLETDIIKIRVTAGLARSWRRMIRKSRELGCKVDPTDAVKRAIRQGNKEIRDRLGTPIPLARRSRRRRRPKA